MEFLQMLICPKITVKHVKYIFLFLCFIHKEKHGFSRAKTPNYHSTVNVFFFLFIFLYRRTRAIMTLPGHIDQDNNISGMDWEHTCST